MDGERTRNFIGNVRRSADIELAIVDYLGKKFRGKGLKNK